MFVRLLFTSVYVLIVVQSTITKNLKDKPVSSFTFPKSYPIDDDYDLNDKKFNTEDSGSIAGLDEYIDEDDYDQSPKIISTTMTSSISTTTKRIFIKFLEQKKKNDNGTKKNYLDTSEFYDDYKDDMEDDAFYNEATIKSTTTSLPSTRSPSVTHRPASFRVLVNFLTRPPIAAGILGGLAIGILTSVILLICIVQHFHKRERTHSSYTTGLLYPNQYGYSKTPQEFYA
jgi:hypothetical protein